MRLPRLVLILCVFILADILPSHASATQYQYGDADEAELGKSLAAVGDLNGDGYPDFVAGAPAERGFAGQGRVLVYFGGSHTPLAPSLVLSAGTLVVGFGHSVAGGGDFNGDGYPDLIVGSQEEFGTSGTAYVFFGGASMHELPDLVLQAPAGAIRFGYRVAFVGDRNHDGFADVAVSAPAWSGDTAPPHVFVFDGGLNPSTSPAEVLNQPGTLSSFGASLASAGDVNGDGYSDLIVGEFSSDLDPNPLTGSVYLYFGGANPGTTPDRTFTGASGELFGCSLAGAVDLNRDGFDDIVIASPDNNPPGVSNAGMIQVFYGGSNMDTRADVARFGRDYALKLGISMAAGDINGDGIADLAVGSSAPTGGVAIYYGAAPLHNAPDRWIPQSVTGTYNAFPYSVAIPGDLDGDGLSEMVASAPHYSTYPPALVWRGALQIESGLQVVNVPDPTPSFAFHAPLPNPACDVVSLSLTLDHADRLSVEIYDLSGRAVARPIENEMLGPGPVSRVWSLRGLPSGIYWVSAKFANRNVTQRLVHLQGRLVVSFGSQ